MPFEIYRQTFGGFFFPHGFGDVLDRDGEIAVATGDDE